MGPDPPHDRLDQDQSSLALHRGTLLVCGGDVDGAHKVLGPHREVARLRVLRRCAATAALEAGLGFVLAQYDDLVRELIAVGVSNGRLREVYRVGVPFRTRLLTDRASRRVWLLAGGEDALSLHPLGAEPPAISRPEIPAGDDSELPDVDGPFACWDFPEENSLGDVRQSLAR